VKKEKFLKLIVNDKRSSIKCISYPPSGIKRDATDAKKMIAQNPRTAFQKKSSGRFADLNCNILFIRQPKL
jgi:hypothetical protein